MVFTRYPQPNTTVLVYKIDFWVHPQSTLGRVWQNFSEIANYAVVAVQRPAAKNPYSVTSWSCVLRKVFGDKFLTVWSDRVSQL